MTSSSNLRQLLNEGPKRVQQGERKIAHQLEIISTIERKGGDAVAAKRLLKFLERTQASVVADGDRLSSRLAATERG
jgi:hypothetical protein